MPGSRVLDISDLQTFTAVNLLSDAGAIGGPTVIPNCTQVVLTWTLDGGKVGHNVLYGRSAGVPTPSVAQAQAIFTALTTGAGWTAIAARLATTTALSSVSVMSVHTASQPIFFSTGTAVPGTATLPVLPNEMAVCVTLRTALRGISNRGRMYIPGYNAAQVQTGNVIAPGAVTDTQTWANGFIAAFSGQSLTLVIGQRERQAYTGTSGTPHPARPAGSVPVTQLIVRDNHWDSQRRRGLK